MATINTYHNSKWKLLFSNIPTIEVNRDINSIYENFIKSITIPDYNIENIFVDFKGTRKRQPISRYNDNLTPIMLEFKLNEDLSNYLNFVEYLQQMRYGQPSTEFIKDNTIKSLNVIFLDNQKRDTYKIYFTNCFIESLSSLPLNMGDDSDITFTVTMTYDEMKFERINN